MNNFFRNKTGLTGNDSKKPAVRKETVYVTKPHKIEVTNRSAQPQQSVPIKTRPPAGRFQLSSTSNTSGAKGDRDPHSIASHAISSARGVKRKSATPQPERPLFSDDEDDDDSSGDDGQSDSDISRKRLKSSVSSFESLGPQRKFVIDDSRIVEQKDFVHSAHLTSGVHEDKYQNPWHNEQFETAEIQYPSKSERERFELKWPKQGSDEYRPFDDVKETIKHVVTTYFPSDIRHQYLDDSSGFERRLNRAWQHQDAQQWVKITDEYNDIVERLVADGSVHKELTNLRRLDLELVKRILDQIYSRTVSLKVEKLRAYKIGTDNVYGELLPRFVREIFERTQLNHDHVFVDLGSGVGNVVLQAALDVGCESWGIEMMKTPCELADLQAKEFAARSRLWGLSSGEVHLLEGDFTQNQEIGAVLKRADLVLVNNQAFTSALNEKLIAMFLDLKEGAKVVSLKPFVPEGHKISLRNIQSPINQFVQSRFEWFPDYVSWGGNGGYYYVATKDARPLKAYLRKHSGV